MTEFKRVYLDTAPIIYYLENNSLYRDKMKRFFEDCLNHEVQLVTSVITVEEYLVFPYATGKMEFAYNFRRFLKYLNVEVVGIDDATAERAAELRGRFKHFRAMDALQIASAIVSGCDVFLTNDKQLRQETALPCMTMDDL